MVHICKRIISPGVFYIFPNYNFLGQQWGIREKMAQNDKKLSVPLHSSGSIRHMIVSFGTQMYNDEISK